jgi:hypothetical protein
MLTLLPRRRPARPVVLTERGQMLALLLTLLGILFWICAAAKGLV